MASETVRRAYVFAFLTFFFKIQKHDFFTFLGSLRYDTRCYFNVRSKANTSQLNLYRTEPTTKKRNNRKVKTDVLSSNSKQSGGIM